MLSTEAPAPTCRHAFDRDAYDARIRPLLPEALARARRILRSHDLACDALQEALFALWREPVLPPDVRGWLIKTAVHRSLHVARTRRRRCDRERCACGAHPELQLDGDPAALAESRELEQHLDRAVRGLPAEQRAVFLMREQLGLDYTSIATELRVPVGTVRSRLARARTGLMERLAPLLAGV